MPLQLVATDISSGGNVCDAGFSDLHVLARLLANRAANIEHSFVTARQLLRKAGSLVRLLDFAPSKLRAIGAGDAEIEAICAVKQTLDIALYRRAEERPVLGNSRAVIDLLHARMAHLPQEHFVCLYLSGNLRLLHMAVIGVGFADRVDIDTAAVMREAIEVNSCKIIVSHNHPSGSLTPSRPDIQITHSLIQAAKTLGITILDHLIIAETGFSSLKAEGLM